MANQQKKNLTPARPVGIAFQGALEVAILRGDKTIERITIGTADGAGLYSITDARRWLSHAEKAIADKVAEINRA